MMLKPLATFVLATTLASAAQAAVPIYGFVVKNSYPHDPKAFTQGLFFRDGHLYETTGRNGTSSLRKVELTSGKVLQKADMPADVFGEGSTPVGNDILALTWTSQVGYVFDKKTFKLKQTFKYVGEGWGLASDAKQVYMSDGSSFIRILEPKTMKELRRIQVSHGGKAIPQLNELEMVDGELFSNVWGTELILRIDPASGAVKGVINLDGLLPPAQRGTLDPDAVLNGIAWDSKGKRLFVTGKLWPRLYEIELVPQKR
ncbi:glutaminyl-peptide cyclotransferase [Massilia sp. LjRoot122]|uniref:glutaminyl-peptide cyclotransferase n=1 Tax=Massilia sp. LjRoot122 TaxID=3342257 RepID=UPI003ECC7FD0